MPQSSPLSGSLAVHTDALAVAEAAQAHGAAVVSRGNIGTRQRDIDPLGRRLPATSPQRVFVSEAGPCGYGLYRSLTTQGQGCWVGAPSLIPKEAGDRVKTNRCGALTLARLRRSGDLSPVDVPALEDEARRDLCRARADVLRDLKVAGQACLTL
jgi:transposase